MKTREFTRAGVIGLLTAFGLLYSAAVSFAQTEELGADVVITGAALSVSQVSSLSLAVTGPSLGLTTFTIDPSGAGSCTPLGGVGGTCGSFTLGNIVVAGGEGASVAMESAAGIPTNCIDAGVFLSNVRYSIAGDAPFGDNTNFVIGTGGSTQLVWGADFTITSAAASTSCTVEVTVIFGEIDQGGG